MQGTGPVDPHPGDGGEAWQTPGLPRTDAWFRLLAKVTLALLLVTLVLYALEADEWRVAFTLAHLAALVALVPLGVVLVIHAFRQARAMGDPGIAGVLRRYRATVFILAVIALAVAISLLNFEDENRAARRAANFTTVGLIVFLVIRYLRWSARMRGRPTLGEGRLF